MVEPTYKSVRKFIPWKIMGAGMGISCVISFTVAVLGLLQLASSDTDPQVLLVVSLTQIHNQGKLCLITGVTSGVISIVLLPPVICCCRGRAEGLCSILMFSIFSIWWLAVGGTSINATGGGFNNCSRYSPYNPITGEDDTEDALVCQVSAAITILSFLNAIILMLFDVVLLLRRCCCGKIGKDVTDTELTAVGNVGVSTLEDDTDFNFTAAGYIGVSTLEDGTDTNLTAARYIEVSTLEDGKDADLTAVRINNTQDVVDNEVSPPNECPPGRPGSSFHS